MEVHDCVFSKIAVYYYLRARIGTYRHVRTDMKKKKEPGSLVGCSWLVLFCGRASFVLANHFIIFFSHHDYYFFYIFMGGWMWMDGWMGHARHVGIQAAADLIVLVNERTHEDRSIVHGVCQKLTMRNNSNN